jgi:ribosome-dependent ATPase
VIRVTGARLRYRRQTALAGIDLSVRAGERVALIGPDGVGKSSLLALIAGARRLQEGEVEVLGGSMRSARHRHRTCQRIAYLPQGLGRNLYDSLSVRENVGFFARLFGGSSRDREERIAALTESTGLAPFRDRPVAHLSGGMKQKVGLCCALVHDPDLLLLDEPTTGIDPLSRRQFWELIAGLRAARPQLALLLATSYLSEARDFDTVLALEGGQALARGTPQDLLARTGRTSLEQAFLASSRLARSHPTGLEPTRGPMAAPAPATRRNLRRPAPASPRISPLRPTAPTPTPPSPSKPTISPYASGTSRRSTPPASASTGERSSVLSVRTGPARPPP